METADERLIVMLEARISEFEKRMGQAERRGSNTYNRLRRDSRSATDQMAADMSRGASRINQSLAAVTTRVGTFGKAFIGGLAAGVIATTLAGINGSLRQAIGSMADLADEADRLGIGVEDLQALQAGLKLSGVETEQTTKALEQFNDRLADAVRGEGELVKRLEEGGIALTDSQGNIRSTVDILKDYSDMMAEAPDAITRMGMATDAFGRGGKAMVAALASGREGITGMMQDAEAAGLVIDEELIRKAAELDDKWDVLTMRIANAFKSGIVSAAEFFGFIEDKMAETNDKLDRVGDEAVKSVDTAVRALAGDIAALFEVGADETALALSDIVDEMDRLNGAFDAGRISAFDFEAGMKEATTQARSLLEEANGVNGVDLSGAIGSIDLLSGALSVAFGWAEALRGALPGATAGSTETRRGEDSQTRGFQPSDGVPTIRPQRPGVNSHGDWLDAQNGGGGGGGASRIESLLEDLQTEREILDAWYLESQEMLMATSDAELELVGGRQEAIERLEQEHMERLRGIRGEGYGSQLSEAGDFFGSMADLASAGGQRLVKVTRTLGAAEALANTLVAQSQVLRDPTLGWWGKLAAYASIGAAGARVVSSLGGSGGGIGSTRGSSRQEPQTAPEVAPEGPLRVLAQGIDPKALFTGQMVMDLYDNLAKEAGKRGVALTFV